MLDEARMSSVADRIAERVIARLTEQSAQEQAEADRREAQAATDRRIEDLRVSLIQAINTALSRAGVELPTSAAATVEPVPPKYTTVAECLHVDNLEASAAATAEPSVTGEVPLSFRLMVERDAARAEVKALEDWRADVRDEALKELATWRSSHWAAVMRENEDLKRQLAEAAEWRPMAELPKDGPVLLRTEPGFFAWRLNPALSKTFQRDSEYLGWLPIPPYRTKEGQ